MGLYALYVFGSRRYRLREDLAGDSLYYLGFLYTLTSLACALYAFMQDEGNTQGIIANFGIALATTILGMALRVMFSQMREDPVEIEHEARLELSEAITHLKTELHDAVLEFNTFRRATIQSLEEGRQESQETMRQAMTDSTTGYATMVRAMASTLEDLQEQVRVTLTDSTTGYATVVRAMASTLENLQEQVRVTLTDSTTGYTDVATAMASTLENLQERVHVALTESLTGYANVERRMLAHIEAALTECTQHTRTLQESAKKITTATKSLLARVERIEAPANLLERMFTPALETLWTSLQHTLEQYHTIQAPQIDALQASMQQATEGLRVQATHLAQVQQILDAVASSAHMLAAHLAAWRTTDEQHTTTISQEFVLLQQLLATFRQEVAHNGELLSQVAGEAAADLDIVRTHRQALAAELHTSRQLVSDVHTSLVSMTSFIVEKLHER